MNMKFVRGMVIGTLVAGGIAMMYKDNMGMNKKKMMKKGRQFARKMGML